MNERINELRKQVKVDMHLHNVEDIKAMEGCFGFEGGNKIVNDYIEKFAELIVDQMLAITDAHTEVFQTDRDRALIEHIKQSVKQHFGVER